MNELGYTGKEGGEFMAFSIRRLAARKIYIGVFDTKMADKVSHRPDLQIISVEQFERVQELIRSRKGNSRDMGRRGHYIFTGFVVCGNCGGSMVAAKQKTTGYVAYHCENRRRQGKADCTGGKAYSERLILPPIIEFLAGFIQNQIDFDAVLDNAAAKYGKSVTEEAIEAAVQGELASVQAGKQRLIEAISLGILTNQEAAVKLAELREQEQRLTVELSSIAEKAAIMAQWQEAIDVLKGQDITSLLYELAETNPVSFRRLLSLVFEPNSLRVRTEHRKKTGWVGVLESYELTETMQSLIYPLTTIIIIFQYV